MGTWLAADLAPHCRACLPPRERMLRYFKELRRYPRRIDMRFYYGTSRILYTQSQSSAHAHAVPPTDGKRQSYQRTLTAVARTDKWPSSWPRLRS